MEVIWTLESCASRSKFHRMIRVLGSIGSFLLDDITLVK